MKKILFFFISIIFLACSTEENPDKGCKIKIKNPEGLKESVCKSITISELFLADTFIVNSGARFCGNVNKCTVARSYDPDLNQGKSIQNLNNSIPDKIFLTWKELNDIEKNYQKQFSDTIDLPKSFYSNIASLTIHGEILTEDSVQVYFSIFKDSTIEYGRLFYYENNKWKWIKTKGRYE